MLKRKYSIIISFLIALGMGFGLGWIYRDSRSGMDSRTVGIRQSQDPIGGAPPSDEELSANTDQTEYGAVVHYTNSGFFPSLVVIRTGETVQWINDSSNVPLWIASSPHPQHTDYAGFDQRFSVGRGGIYTFTFNKTGIWNYHNHEDPLMQGKIMVF